VERNRISSLQSHGKALEKESYYYYYYYYYFSVVAAVIETVMGFRPKQLL